MSQPIVGYNVIKTYIENAVSGEVIDALVSSIDNADVGKIEAMVNLIGQNDDGNGFLGDLRTVQACTVPAKGFVRVKCKFKGDVKGMDLQFLCLEPCIANWDEDLVVTVSLGELKRGRTPHVNVEIRNTAAVNKYIPKNVLVSEISMISAVLPLKLFNVNLCDGAGEGDVMKVEASSDVKLEKWQPQAKLNHLGKKE